MDIVEGGGGGGGGCDRHLFCIVLPLGVGLNNSGDPDKALCWELVL